MIDYIPLSIPNIKANEIKYVTEALKSGWVSSAGPYVEKFETAIAEYVNSYGAVSCQNGTSGLHLALKVVGVKPNDLVLAPTVTFIAAVNPIKYLGADPIFIDCDDRLCIDPIKIEAYITDECETIENTLIHKQSKRKVKAIMVVHVFGNMANMEKIMDIADTYNLRVIEDATEALGSYYTNGILKNKYAGTLGDVGVFSFNGNKIITTGGGGMIVSNEVKYLKKAKYLSTQAKDDALFFIHDEIGYNYRMTNIQAAIGLAQLEELENFIEIKKRNYNLYNELLKTIDFQLLDFNDNIRPNYWFFSLLLNDKIDQSNLIAYFEKNNIQTRPIWGLIHKQKPYQENLKSFTEKADYFEKNILNLPCSSNLTSKNVTYIVSVLKNYIDTRMF